MLLAERRSKQGPPPSPMFDSLVGELPIWWVSVEGEREPVVLAAERPKRLTYASPFLWRSSDVVEVFIEPLGQGSLVRLQHLSDEPFDLLEAAAIRHRWGEHLDRDLRDRFDCGGRPGDYQVSLYRGDVEDWAILDRVLEVSWRAVERIPVVVRSPTLWHGYTSQSEGGLLPGDVIWAGELGKNKTSVGGV